MANEKFCLLFDGTARPSDVPIEKTIQLLRAYNLLIRRASGTLYGSRTDLNIRIEHIKSGSYELSGLFSIVGGLQPIFPLLPAISLGIDNIPDLIKKWLDLLIFFKGSPPTQVTQSGDGTNIQLTNRDGEIKITNGNTYQTFIIGDVGTLSQPLQAPVQYGAKSLRVIRGNNVIAEYSSDDVRSFMPIRPAGEAVDTEIDAILLVVSPVLEGEGVWKFKYGNMNLVAKIQDTSYLEKVFDGTVSFKHGDRIVARLRTIQRQNGSKLITNHYIVRVLEDSSPP